MVVTGPVTKNDSRDKALPLLENRLVNIEKERQEIDFGDGYFSGYPCLSGVCLGCTDQAAGLSSLSASAAAAVACTLSGV